LLGLPVPLANTVPPMTHPIPESDVVASPPASIPLLDPESTPLPDPESAPLFEPESTPLLDPESSPLFEPESTPLFDPALLPLLEPEPLLDPALLPLPSGGTLGSDASSWSVMPKTESQLATTRRQGRNTATGLITRGPSIEDRPDRSPLACSPRLVL
jgi:hypothetical protein